ncbi:hypothetical protein C5F59_010165 [Streptomyces sp. QL37]|uniref:hypothetical protein n=1 Tax=Streptomyces sp. QL37 TaxID=2093747 RepID=UPI000CF262A9|nr:hypothetical protein [Streptomyces sp. QL37]PPQ60194.1 hypothetical protein C5F59_28590 [Streptomyces sp. QL37]
MVQKPQSGAEGKERRIDLSLPQVAGSAVAAVAAAVMASQLGVYGTIAGAGVMSVVATCGGSVFQHFFRRTGEQIREVTVQVKNPAGRQVTVHTRQTPGPRRPEDDATRVLRTVEPGADRTTVLRQVRPGAANPGGVHPGGPAADETSPGGPRPGDAFTDGAYSDARTHGTRVRGWKRSALAATGVFVLSMAGITVYEMVSGHDLGGNGRTTIGTVVSGERHGGTTSPSPSPSDSTGQEDQGDRGDDRNAPGSGSTTSPGTGRDDGGSAQPDPSGGDSRTTGPNPTPSASGGATTPEATAPAEPGDAGTPPAAPDPSGAEDVPDQQGGDTAGSDTDR